MKKKLVIALLAGCMCMVSACGGKKEKYQPVYDSVNELADTGAHADMDDGQEAEAADVEAPVAEKDPAQPGDSFVSGYDLKDLIVNPYYCTEIAAPIWAAMGSDEALLWVHNPEYLRPEGDWSGVLPRVSASGAGYLSLQVYNGSFADACADARERFEADREAFGDAEYFYLSERDVEGRAALLRMELSDDPNQQCGIAQVSFYLDTGRDTYAFGTCSVYVSRHAQEMTETEAESCFDEVLSLVTFTDPAQEGGGD